MKDIVGTVGKYIRDFSKEDQSTVYTPMNIAEDMVNLLPDDIFSPDKKFIDIACKSGRFLLAIYNRLMSSPYMANMELEQRSKWILDNQLYAIALTEISSVLIRKSLYDDYTVKGNIILINSYTDKIKKNNFGQNANGSVKTLKELLSEEFNQVNFNVVIGNPPYNNDIYLDFVTQGHSLAKQYDVWITPAKWQAKGGKKNEDFRENIVPYMSRIVYYPDCSDIFNIAEQGGICYFNVEKNINSIKEISNKCNLCKGFNSSYNRPLDYSLNNIGNEIIKKVIHKNQYNLIRRDYKYKVITSNIISFGGGKRSGTLLFSSAGNLQCLGLSRIIDENGEVDNSYNIVFTSNSYDECSYFVSWEYTKFIRFLILMRVTGQGGLTNKETWRFVPDPGSFDKIYEDNPLPGYEPDENGEYIDSNGNKHCSLYKKYNLTQDEIDIIESVIKAR